MPSREEGEAPQQRMCPACGVRCRGAHCAVDGVATVRVGLVDPDAAVFRVGDLLQGRYRIVRTLGRGGFGAVYEAVHTGTLQPVAVKVLTRAGEGDGAAEICRFHREATRTAALCDPHTVRVFDFGQTDGGAVFLVMELLRGESLEAMLRRREAAADVLSEDETVAIADAVLSSLSEAHALGLVHRDLKPANIFLTAQSGGGNPRLKVLDFGVAGHIDAPSSTGGGAICTPATMSPEQCSGDPVDGRADLYALGIVLFRCVTGRAPFSGSHPLELLRHHVETAPPDVATLAGKLITPRLGDVIMRALAKAPAERWPSAVAMRAALIADRSVPAAPAPPPSAAAEAGAGAREPLADQTTPAPRWSGPSANDAVAARDLMTAAAPSRHVRQHRWLWASGAALVVLASWLVWARQRGPDRAMAQPPPLPAADGAQPGRGGGIAARPQPIVPPPPGPAAAPLPWVWRLTLMLSACRATASPRPARPR